MRSRKEKKISDQELSKYASDLQEQMDKIVAQLGFNLLNISFVTENGTNYLRLTISHVDCPISLNDCELVSKEVEKELDLRDPIPFSYVLEVGSKGISKEGANEGEHEFVLQKLGLTIKS